MTIPIQPYDVLVGRAADRRREGAPDDTPRHPLLAEVSAVAGGWTPLPSTPGGAALDVVRGNLLGVRGQGWTVVS